MLDATIKYYTEYKPNLKWRATLGVPIRFGNLYSFSRRVNFKRLDTVNLIPLRPNRLRYSATLCRPLRGE